jgi:ERF superfamily
VTDTATPPAPPKPTLASLASELADAKESATVSLDVSQANGEKISALDKERIALTRAVSMMRDRLDKVAENAVNAEAVDGVLARIEAVERRTSGETGDWAPVIQKLDERLRELADLIGEGSTGVVDPDARNMTPKVDYLADRIDGLARAQKDTHEKLLARVQYIERVMNERTINDAVATEMHGDNVRPGSPNTASAKVLDLMRMVDVIGKEKDFVSNQARFKFRGVDQAMDATGHAMREVGLTLRTKVLDRETTRDKVVKEDNKGKSYEQLWTTTILTMGYTFVDPMTGHEHPFEMVGEGRDVSDKSSSKAAAMACKYALFQALMIPVEGLNDTDSDSERPVVERSQAMADRPAEPTPAPAGPAQSAATAARYIIEVQERPAGEALPALRKAKDKIEQLGIGHLVVGFDKVGETRGPLSALVNAALQSVNAAVSRTAGAQGVTRAAQQAGEGARAAGPSRADYEEALKVIDSDAPQDVVNAAVAIVNTFMTNNPEERERQRAAASERGWIPEEPPSEH